MQPLAGMSDLLELIMGPVQFSGPQRGVAVISFLNRFRPEFVVSLEHNNTTQNS